MEVPSKDTTQVSSTESPSLTTSEPSQSQSSEGLQKVEATSATGDEVSSKEDKPNVSEEVQQSSGADSQEFSNTREEVAASGSTELKQLNIPDEKTSSSDTAISKGEQQTVKLEDTPKTLPISKVAKKVAVTEKVQETLDLPDVAEAAITTGTVKKSKSGDEAKGAIKRQPAGGDKLSDVAEAGITTGAVKKSQSGDEAKGAIKRQPAGGDTGAVKRTTSLQPTEGSATAGSLQPTEGSATAGRQTFSQPGGVKQEPTSVTSADAAAGLQQLTASQDSESEDIELRARMAQQSLTQENKHVTDHLFKILVIGDIGAGKTSIIRRYTENTFSLHYRYTIGVEFSLKVIKWDPSTTVRLQIWDIAGFERFGTMTRIYYKEAYGAIVVCDATKLASFQAVIKWKDDLDKNVLLPDGSKIPCILALNKYDEQTKIIPQLLDSEFLDQFCEVNNIIAWYHTSAKENINVYDVFTALTVKMMSLERTIGKLEKDPEIVDFSEPRRMKKCNC